jgi:hypothetical protein
LKSGSLKNFHSSFELPADTQNQRIAAVLCVG